MGTLQVLMKMLTWAFEDTPHKNPCSTYLNHQNEGFVPTEAQTFSRHNPSDPYQYLQFTRSAALEPHMSERHNGLQGHGGFARDNGPRESIATIQPDHSKALHICMPKSLSLTQVTILTMSGKTLGFVSQRLVEEDVHFLS